MHVEIAPGITVDPGVRFGKPVIAGTRVPVDLILAKLAGGMRDEEVAEEYDLTLDDVRAALGYAASVLANEEVRVNRSRPTRIDRNIPLVRASLSPSGDGAHSPAA